MKFKPITKLNVIGLNQKVCNLSFDKINYLNESLIESALNYVGLEENKIPEIAGIIGYRICKNHAFIDGNKQTAYLSIEYFLSKNNFKFCGREKDLENLIVNIATNHSSKEDIMAYLNHNCKKRDYS